MSTNTTELRTRLADGKFAPKGRAINSKLVHARIPDQVYDLLCAKAQAENLTLGEYLRYLIQDAVLVD